MHVSPTRIFAGLVVAAALGLGAVGARADSANGPDAGIGIPGYNLNYDHAADGSGPGYKRNNGVYQHHYKYSYRRNGQRYYQKY